MKVFGKIELPINIDTAFDHLISGMRNENSDKLGFVSRVTKEIGDLGAGSIIETTYVDRNIRFDSEIIENKRPHSFVHRTVSDSYEITVAINLVRNGNSTILQSCSTLTYKNVIKNLIISYYASGMMRSRHFLDSHAWSYLFPDGIVKGKYSCTILGLPYYLVGAPLILAIFYVLAKIQEYFGLNRDY